jgi:hypothetical protein
LGRERPIIGENGENDKFGRGFNSPSINLYTCNFSRENIIPNSLENSSDSK